jgi:site-specific DNA recombinase
VILKRWKKLWRQLVRLVFQFGIVWNRQRYIKDPSSGKRQARLNPEHKWVTEEVPSLRIIDDAL